MVRTVIGRGAPGVEGTAKAHGSPLGEALLGETKALEADLPDRAAEFRRTHERRLPDGLREALELTADEAPRATRQSSQACLNAALSVMPALVGGSADLAGSTRTVCGDVVTRDDHSRTAIAFGIREFRMTAILNGMTLPGGFRVFGSTFWPSPTTCGQRPWWSGHGPHGFTVDAVLARIRDYLDRAG